MNLLLSFKLILLFLLRNTWPAERDEPDVTAGSHIRLGVLVMHGDVSEDDHSREDYHQQQEENHAG